MQIKPEQITVHNIYQKDKKVGVIFDADLAEKITGWLNDAPTATKETIYPEGILAFDCGGGNLMYFGQIQTLVFNEEIRSQVIEYSTDYQSWVNSHLYKKHPIKQVKNKLGEVLTVGSNTDIGVIQSFVLTPDGRIGIFASERPTVYLDMNLVHHAQTTYKTADGYEISHNKVYHLISKDNFKLTTSVWGDNFYDPIYEKYLVFENIKNAEAYIDLNKKQYSKQNILDAVCEPPPMIENLMTNVLLVDKTKLWN